MTITRHRFFGAFLDTQEAWLNKMSAQGYRLVKTGKITYEFEEIQPNSVQYKMEFIADKSVQNSTEYRKFLEDMGYKVFVKNINLQYSWGKARSRPWAKKNAKLATSFKNKGFTTFDRELFIVEKQNDGKPFELHTTNKDRAVYYAALRNAWLCIAALFGILGVVYLNIAINSALVALAFAGLFAIPFVRYQNMITQYKKMASQEQQ